MIDLIPGTVRDGMILEEYGVVLPNSPTVEEFEIACRFFRYHLWAEGVYPEGEVRHVVMDNPYFGLPLHGIYCLGWSKR